MGKCEYCGAEESERLTVCRQCGLRLCHVHELPENHRCRYLCCVPGMRDGAGSEDRGEP